MLVQGLLSVCCRMLNIIDGLAHDIQDPQIFTHISNVSSAVQSVIRISITFIGYEVPKYVVCASLQWLTNMYCILSY